MFMSWSRSSDWEALLYVVPIYIQWVSKNRKFENLKHFNTGGSSRLVFKWFTVLFMLTL